MNALLLVFRCLLALVFLAAAVGKLMDLAGSRYALEQFGVPVRVARLACIALPVAELAVAAALVVRPSARWGAVGALILLLAFIVGVARAMSQGKAPDCRCFGQIRSEPAGRSTLIRNAFLGAMAVAIVAAGTGPSVDGRLRSLNGTQLALVAVSALATLLALAVAQLVSDRRRLQRQLKNVIAANARAGLPRGTPAPEFTLSPVGGEARSLGELTNRGRKTILVFVSTDCGPCLEMLPSLARWQDSLADRLTLPAIFAGERVDVDRLSEEHDLWPALAQEDNEAFELYGLRATPSAVLIIDGIVASAPAEGVPAIEALIRSAVADRRRAELVVHHG